MSATTAEEVTPEDIEMLMVFDRLKLDVAVRLHHAWDIDDDGMPFRSISGDGAKDLNELLKWLHEQHPKIVEAIGELEDLCCCPHGGGTSA
jgi:hypothetical protein